ncbi:MAG TPA: PDZ domain-containing protein [Candidatus Xenobia bacterium]|jgi:predicted metalloprotease with PDZ domain
MNARIRYEVSMPRPATHVFHVDMTVESPPDPLELVLPAWTPGSYKIRDYARHVQDFKAPGQWRKTDKNTWRIDHGGRAEVTVSYRVYANELTVRTSHLTEDHALFNGTNLFFYVKGQLDRPIELRVEAPPGWQVTTALPLRDGVFMAPDYDTLADSPVECGTQKLLTFEVAGRPHQVALVGDGNYDPARLTEDLQAICSAAVDVFRELPCDRYIFICELPAVGRGGLEHKNSTVVMFGRFDFRPSDRYESFLALCAHEYFHLWNGKRLHPPGLGPFDYEKEVHTHSLWVVEGWTSYYNDLLLLRAGRLDGNGFLKLVAKTWNGLRATPGRSCQSLTEASFDTWIKYYQRTAHSVNSTVSYYEKGALVALLLDLEIRWRTQGQRSLDDVLRALWREYGRTETAWPEGAVEALAEEMAGDDMRPFFRDYVEGTAELPMADSLARFGIKTVVDHPAEPVAPWIGLHTRHEGGRTVVTEVLWEGPAWRAGINAGDELVAFDGHRLTDSNLKSRLADKRQSDRIELIVFRDDLLKRFSIELSEPPWRDQRFEADTESNSAAAGLYAGWLGQPHPAMALQQA